MITAEATASLRAWLVKLFVNAIGAISKEEDREEVLRWLELSRQVLDSDLSAKEKFAKLYALTDARKTAQIVLNSVFESVKNYKNADLPLAVKVSIPLTLLAVPVIGGHGAGIAALGSAIGLPALVLVFLGSAGITSVLETFARHPSARASLAAILALIAHDEVLRQIKAAIKAGRQGPPRQPVRSEMPEDEVAIRLKLLSMDPIEFESHVMSFFGDTAAVTQQCHDGEIDGFAKSSDGKLIVVQCKRYAPENPIGRPDIHQFRGALEEYEANSGYFVTTSYFTDPARDAAAKSQKISLIALEDLVLWHQTAPAF